MVKYEQFRITDQLAQVVSTEPIVPLPLRSPMFQTTSISIPQRSIDPRAIDISSIKGRFAWEKIALGDTYIPVIFRGTTKYFCIKMLRKLLSDYPEDVIRRSSYYQYRKPIDLYVATPNELDLLNRINAHHSHWAYSPKPFNAGDDLVRVSDFLPFYEHLRLVFKTPSFPRPASSGSLRPILPQPQRSPDFVVNTSNTVRENSAVPVATTSIQTQPCITTELSRGNISAVPRPIAPVPSAQRPARPQKYSTQPSATARQSSKNQVRPLFNQQSLATSSNNLINSTNTGNDYIKDSLSRELGNLIARPNKSWAIPRSTSSLTSSSPSLTNSSVSPDSAIPSPVTTTSRTLSITSSENQLSSILKPPSLSSSSPALSKSAPLHSGWLQINKLYTPYISTDTSNHHLYKIPVSLLTFYDLLKSPSLENNSNESKETSCSFEQTLVTPQEIELINELCLKQNIKPFSIDTKLINLATFYQCCSANILFVKELPINEPKVSICKDWSSIVQINGGICRLRNITTLHEQTVPFIGNNLLKNFVISSQSLLTASLSTPTASETEFLQLILFFSNLSINIPNAKLIDIESVQKEYNVDLILLFNDKFPLNVLNYQQQDNRSSISQEQVHQPESSAAANTFAESTPPPSPLSPPTTNTHVNPTSQLPLTPSSSTSSNRYQKTITFHGHSMTAYICSGLGSNAQRECISVKALCNMLYPNSSILDKLETRMLRLLRSKNINRFRPQNQQAMGFTRLIDVKDVENHWDYIKNGMSSLSNNDGETNVVREVISSLSDKTLKASTLDKVENACKNIEQNTSSEVNKGEKRSLERGIIEENVPVVERIEKRIRFSGEDQNEQPSKLVRSQLIKRTDQKKNHSVDDDDDESKDEDQDDDEKLPKNRRTSVPIIKIVPRKTHKTTKKKLIHRSNDRIKSTISLRKPIVPLKKKIILRKRPTPCKRSSQQIVAAWVKKYGIEDCCIRLDLYNPIYDTGRN